MSLITRRTLLEKAAAGGVGPRSRGIDRGLRFLRVVVVRS